MVNVNGGVNFLTFSNNFSINEIEINICLFEFIFICT